MQGLGSGNYRVFAVNDQFRDYLFQQDQDQIGIPHQDILLTDQDSIYTNLYFLLFNADTTKPRLISGIMTDRNHILVSSNKVLNEQSIRADNYSLFDSTDNKNYKIVYAFKGKTKPEEFILMLDAQIYPDHQVYLFADTLTDLLNNVMINDFTKVVVSDRVDTSSIKIISTEPAAGGLVDFDKAEIKIFFDEAFNKELINTAVALTDTLNKPIGLDIDFTDDATLIIKPAENLKADKDYLVKLQLGSFVDISGNRKDSIFTLKLRTISGLDFTGLTGNIINLDYSKTPILILENTSTPQLKYKQMLVSDKFEFNRIEPGK
jgi:hypothetical protein